METSPPEAEHAPLDVDILSVSSLEEDTIYIDDVGETTTDDYDYVQEINKYEPDSGNASLASITPPASLSPAIAVDNIAISSSQDVTIGNQTYFQGPVVIKNLLTTSGGPFGDEKHRISITSTINISTKKRDSNEGADRPVGGHIRRLVIMAILIAVALSVIGIFVVVIVLVTAPRETTTERPTTTPSSTTPGTISSSSSSSSNSTDPTTTDEPTTPVRFRYVPHSDWSNRTESDEIPKLKTPVRDVVIGHTSYANYKPCDTFDTCQKDLLRMDYLFRGIPQIPPNFMLGGYEEAFYGRGFEKQPFIARELETDDVFFVAVLGNFNSGKIDDQMLELFWDLMSEAVEQNVLSDDYRIYLECQFNPDSPGAFSPGLKFIDIIKTWPRWSDEHETRTLHDCSE